MSNNDTRKCIINIPNDIYNKLVYISNVIGVSVPDIITQSIVTKEFSNTVDILFKTAVELSTKVPNTK